MSGASSNVSGGSSGSVRPRSGRIVGVPKRCWCGEQILGLISKSEHNPYRRYYRCAYAVSKKLVNDPHIFKWVDEALLDEIETLQSRLEQEMKHVARNEVVYEKNVFDKVQMKLEKDIFDRIEDVLDEAKSGMKKMMLLVVIGCMIVVGIMALVG